MVKENPGARHPEEGWVKSEMQAVVMIPASALRPVSETGSAQGRGQLRFAVRGRISLHGPWQESCAHLPMKTTSGYVRVRSARQHAPLPSERLLPRTPERPVASRRRPWNECRDENA